jgi:hypothetical protein
MLSRTADNLYWLSRYTERSDFVARILDATMRFASLPTSYGGERNEWEGAVASAGNLEEFKRLYDVANEDTVRDFLAFSPNNPSSLRACIENARENARAVRTALTTEMWDAINSAWLDMRHMKTRDMSQEEFARFIEWAKGVSLAFDGSAYRTMLRNDAFWFTRLGLAIERADNTARILDVKYHMLLPASERVGGTLDYFPVDHDPARGLGGHGLSLGLPREREALARGGPADPQPAAPALARQLLRDPGAPPRPHRRCLWTAGTEPAARQQRPGAALLHGYRRRVQARPARVHRGLHRREQPSRLRDHRAIPDLIALNAHPYGPSAMPDRT